MLLVPYQCLSSGFKNYFFAMKKVFSNTSEKMLELLYSQDLHNTITHIPTFDNLVNQNSCSSVTLKLKSKFTV